MSAEKDSSRDVAVAVLDENRHDSPTLFNDPEKSSEQISSSSSDDAENPRPGMSGFVWALVLVAILSSHFLYALDNTVVADIQPAIISTLGEIDKYPWISVAFVTAAASVTLVWYVSQASTWPVDVWLTLSQGKDIRSLQWQACLLSSGFPF